MNRVWVALVHEVGKEQPGFYFGVWWSELPSDEQILKSAGLPGHTSVYHYYELATAREGNISVRVYPVTEGVLYFPFQLW